MTGQSEDAADAVDPLVRDLLAGEQRALARAISRIENRSPGYRDLVGDLYAEAGDATVVGVTGPPGAGKSTLVDRLVAAYRERDLTVGVIAIDPTSPYSGGAVLGDRIRIGSAVGDAGVFVRSMSTRGSLGGLSTATADAVTAMDAFGFDRIVVETVGAGQNEVDVVRTADTVVLLVPPGGGDDVQMLKAGILEIADCFAVNKADLDGADRTVQRLREMLDERGASPERSGGDGMGERERSDTRATRASEASPRTERAGATDGSDSRAASPDPVGGDGHHGPRTASPGAEEPEATEEWSPPILETVATDGEGVTELLDTIEAHREYLDRSGERAARERTRQAATIRRILRAEVRDAVAAELDDGDRLDGLVERVVDREIDPYTAADEVFGPIAECLEDADAE